MGNIYSKCQMLPVPELPEQDRHDRASGRMDKIYVISNVETNGNNVYLVHPAACAIMPILFCIRWVIWAGLRLFF